MLVITDEMFKESGQDEMEVRLELAIWLYEKQLLTARRAASVAGLFFDKFYGVLKELEIMRWDVPTAEEVMQDYENLKKTFEQKDGRSK